MFSQWMIALSPTHWARSPLTPLLTLPPPPPPVHLFFPSPCCQSPAIPSKEHTSYCDDPVCLHPGKNKKQKRNNNPKNSRSKTASIVWHTANMFVFDRWGKKKVLFFAWCPSSVCPMLKPLWTEPGQIKNQKWYYVPPVKLLSRKLHWMFWLKHCVNAANSSHKGLLSSEEMCWFCSHLNTNKTKTSLVLTTSFCETSEGWCGFKNGKLFCRSWNI